MLERKIMNSLSQWYEKEAKKPLIIEGARQVGKTYSIRQFGIRYYHENVIEINFITDKSLIDIFRGDLSFSALRMKLKLFFPHIDYNKKILLFIDEIQQFSEAITALKSFGNQDEFDVIASGSLLGVHYKLASSFPVGYVERMTLYPLDFEEFMLAVGEKDLFSFVQQRYYNQQKVEKVLHAKMLDLFIHYIVIGGMPEVVKQFKKTKSFNEVIKNQQNIINDYKDDIAKYATTNEKIRVREVFDSIPFQLAKANKKFQYSHVRKGGRSNDYLGSIKWLIDAGIVYKSNLLTNLEIPLSIFSKPDHFKVYLLDTGLLVALLGQDAQQLLLTNKLGIAKGAVYENIIATILKMNGHELYYYERSSGLEIDFITTQSQKVTAVEVKSGENKKAKSLQRLFSENKIDRAFLLSRNNYYENEKTTGLPLYMSAFITKQS